MSGCQLIDNMVIHTIGECGAKCYSDTSAKLNNQIDTVYHEFHHSKGRLSLGTDA